VCDNACMRLTGWPFLNPAIRVLANGYHASVQRENVRYLSTKKAAFNSSSSFSIWQERRVKS